MSMTTQTESQHPEDVQKPSVERNEATPFSQLTYLLRLVTSLNFDNNLPSSFKKKLNTKALDQQFIVLDSVAAILVQSYEVVAACYTTDTVSVIASKADVFPDTDLEVDVDVPSEGPLQSLQLAALSNPDFSDNKKLITSQRLHKIQIQTEGVSYWERVKGSPRGWYCAFMSPIPLKNHVATVSAYLNEYKMTNLVERTDISVRFSNYLISTCWPKMARRITSWQALGFIILLKELPIGQLLRFASTWGGFSSTSGPGDKTLKTFLGSINDNLKRNLLLAEDRDIDDRRLGYREDDFPVMFKSSPEGLKPSELSFRKETVEEFHKLIITALDGFAFSFLRLKKKSNKLNESDKIPLEKDPDHKDPNLRQVLNPKQEDVFHYMKMASNYYRFLLAIICSTSFKDYFEMIKESQSKKNLLPVREQRDFYYEYLQRKPNNSRDPNLKHTGDDVIEANEGEDAEVEVDELDDGGLINGDDDEASLSSLFRFIKTFVVHFLAKRALERHCYSCKDQEVNISLFAAERSRLSIPSGSWPKMQAILKESFSLDSKSSTSADSDIAAKAIRLLEDKIRTPSDLKCSPESTRLIKQFKDIIEGKPICLPGGLHCETVLATLRKYVEERVFQTDHPNISEKLFNSGMISVSKLCCPVCWELLELSRDQTLGPFLRGAHSTIYPVVLPEWLLPTIVEEMKKRFLIHLRDEVEIMLSHDGAEQQVTRQNRHVTHESESNISVASSTNSTSHLEDNPEDSENNKDLENDSE